MDADLMNWVHPRNWNKCPNVIFLGRYDDTLSDIFDIDMMDEVHPTNG